MPKTTQVRSLMTRHPITLRPEQTATAAMQILVKKRVSGAPVVDEREHVLGVLSEKNCMLAVMDAGYYGSESERTVGSLMSSPAEVISPDATLLEVAEYFSLHPYRRLPVVEGERLVGVLSRHDVLKAYLERMKDWKHEACVHPQNRPLLTDVTAQGPTLWSLVASRPNGVGRWGETDGVNVRGGPTGAPRARPGGRGPGAGPSL